MIRDEQWMTRWIAIHASGRTSAELRFAAYGGFLLLDDACALLAVTGADMRVRRLFRV